MRGTRLKDATHEPEITWLLLHQVSEGGIVPKESVVPLSYLARNRITVCSETSRHDE